MLEARALRLALPDRSRKPLFGAPPRIEILKGIDLAIGRGESVGIVGESGSGKTSLGRTLLRLYRPTGGALRFEGRDIAALPEAELRPLRARMQMIFQDPQSALNPRHRIAEILTQPLLAFGRAGGRREGRRRAGALLERVGLPPALIDRYPHQLSGGQRQRVGIARAIALEPAFVVADEIVSGLDVSSQAQILTLLRDLRRDMGLALAFISHDLSVVRVLCERVVVMLRGEIVEEGRCEAVFAAPRHPYTRALIAAIPLPDVQPGWLETAGAAVYAEGQETSVGGRPAAAMRIKNTVALVTGTNRGIGRAVVEALVGAGAGKVYATTRNLAAVRDLVAKHGTRVVPLQLEVTDHARIAELAQSCPDVQLLINNAGYNGNIGLISAPDLTHARQEMEVNYFGTLAMCRAFAPVLKANGGGCIVNMASITGRVCLPFMGSLSASKAAQISMNQGIRAELAAQGTRVVIVAPGAVETDMTKDFPPPKTAPSVIAEAIVAAVEGDAEEIYPGDMGTFVAQRLASDPKGMEKEFAKILPM
jgi:peptide/nickel transport system ATP-binding protein